MKAAVIDAAGALRGKRAELSGQILELEKDLRQRRVDLIHLDATLKLFAPDLSPRTIKPRRPGGRSAWFHRGECARAVLEMLRLANLPKAGAAKGYIERIEAVSAKHPTGGSRPDQAAARERCQ
jgi:hypothetical protein